MSISWGVQWRQQDQTPAICLSLCQSDAGPSAAEHALSRPLPSAGQDAFRQAIGASHEPSDSGHLSAADGNGKSRSECLIWTRRVLCRRGVWQASGQGSAATPLDGAHQQCSGGHCPGYQVCRSASCGHLQGEQRSHYEQSWPCRGYLFSMIVMLTHSAISATMPEKEV